MEFMDGTTRAYVANKDKEQTLAISGKLNVKAIDNNNIETIATATVNADGSPATNMAEVRTTKYEKSTQDKITVNATENGKAAISKESDGSYTITVTPDNGFELDTIKGTKTQVSNADSGSEDQSMLTPVEGKTNVYKIEKAKIDALGENETITVQVTFKGLKRKVTLGDEFKDYIQKSMLSQDKVFLTYEDNIITTGSVEAKQADAVYVTIAPNDGFKVQDGSLYYSKADGSEKTPISVKDTGARNTYGFFVPGNDVVIHATLIRSDEQGRAKNADGKGIGVGAAIIISNIDYVTEAYIGGKVTAEAASADIIADHTEKRLNAAVAGTDPINTPAGMSNAGRTPTVNNTSVDAAVIIVFDDAEINAGVAEGAKITTKDSGNLTVHGTSATDTRSEASGYAAGDQTAVGATVVINVAESNVTAYMDGAATLGGNLDLKGYTYDQDIANAVATAVGADIAR
jgi:hypothetical protein